MLGAFPAFLAVGQAATVPAWTTLVSSRTLSTLLSFTRDTQGEGYDATGALIDVGAGLPRFGQLNGLLIEESRTNGIRNPRCEGATAGTPGVAPTNWKLGTAHGLAIAIVGTGYEDGIPFVDLKVSGTATQAGSSVNWAPEVAGIITAASGEVWTTSGYLSVVAGSLSGISAVNLQIGQHAASTVTYLTTSITPGTGKLRDSRHVYTTTFNKSDMTSTKPLIYLNYSSGAVINVTFRYGAPQVEKGATPTAPILPVASSPQASVRNLDKAFWSRSGGFGTAGTIVVQAVLPQLATGTGSQGVWQLDNGTDSPRFALRSGSGGALVAGLDNGSATSLSLGTVAANTAFRAAFSWDSTGYSAALSGAAAKTVSTGTFTPGRLLLGQGSTSGTQVLNGQVQLLRHHPLRMTDADLASLSVVS
ncbi:hypothetical protein [Roseomonas elaeocarpi]|uniref:Uncharacterized protein n=1 Tax=Roseomonas elaeocarpi TaxID=907779 RepID=A0ABV6JR91_9PROT